MNKNASPNSVNVPLWPHKTAAIVSGSVTRQQQLAIYLEAQQWTPRFFGENLQEAFNSLLLGHVTILIFEDSPQTSAYAMLRQLINHPILALTPCILISSGKQEIMNFPLVRTMGEPELLQTLAQTEFLTTMEKFIKAWERPEYHFLRACAYYQIRNRHQEAQIALMRLTASASPVKNLAVIGLAMLYRNKGDIELCERLLLDHIKSNKGNCGMLLVLADLYQRYAMPKLAKKVYSSIYKAYHQPPQVLLDIVQTNIELHEYSEAISNLHVIMSHKYQQQHCVNFLIKLLLLKGSFSAARNVAKNHPEISQGMLHYWELPEDKPVSPLTA